MLIFAEIMALYKKRRMAVILVTHSMEEAARYSNRLLVISGDKGLAGAYNHNIMKMADTFLKDPSREVHLFVIGETGRQFFRLPAHPD